MLEAHATCYRLLQALQVAEEAVTVHNRNIAEAGKAIADAIIGKVVLAAQAAQAYVKMILNQIVGN